MYQIMLVEDEALVRESMAQNTNWEKFGFAPPHVFENGRQAADHLETVLPDVVITDICMPFLDGLELAKLVYERFPETIVVVLTGFSEFSYAQRAIRYHVHDYLLKPVSPKEFDQLLENLSVELSRAFCRPTRRRSCRPRCARPGPGSAGGCTPSRWRCRRRGRRASRPGASAWRRSARPRSSACSATST